MGKKRKHSETVASAPVKRDAPERPQRTIFGWKDKNNTNNNEAQVTESTVGFRNKEKVLVTCSRRINFRFGNY